MREEDFSLQVFKVLIIQDIASFERPIGDPTSTLKKLDNLVQEFVKCHGSPLTQPASIVPKWDGMGGVSEQRVNIAVSQIIT
jgi:hypothetical protein